MRLSDAERGKGPREKGSRGKGPTGKASSERVRVRASQESLKKT